MSKQVTGILNSTKSFAQSLFLFAKSLQDFIHFLVAFEGSDEVTLFIVKSHIWKAFNFEKWRQYEFSVPSYMNIVFAQIVFLVKTLHGFKWLVGGHNNLDLFERMNIMKDILGLMLTMFAIRAKVHQQHLLVPFQITFGKHCCTINLQ